MIKPLITFLILYSFCANAYCHGLGTYFKKADSGLIHYGNKWMAFRGRESTLFLSNKGSPILLQSDGQLRIFKINGNSYVHYKGFYNGVTLNISFKNKNGTLVPEEGWISPAKTLNLSNEDASVAGTCKKKEDSIESLRSIAEKINRQNDEEELCETITKTMFATSCGEDHRDKISEALSADLALGGENNKFIDCLDNPQKYAKGIELSYVQLENFEKIRQGMSSFLGDLESEKNTSFQFSCKEISANEPVLSYVEGKPRVIQFGLENGKFPSQLPKHKIAQSVYHEIIHFSGVDDEKETNAISALCIEGDPTKLQELKGLNVTKKTDKGCVKTDGTCKPPPPWEANPKKDVKVAVKEVDTTKLSGTEPIPAPAGSDEKNMAAVYGPPGPQQEAAVARASEGMENTYNRVQTFANNLMGATIPSAVASTDTSNLAQPSASVAAPVAMTGSASTNSVASASSKASSSEYQTIAQYTADPKANYVSIKFTGNETTSAATGTVSPARGVASATSPSPITAASSLEVQKAEGAKSVSRGIQSEGQPVVYSNSNSNAGRSSGAPVFSGGGQPQSATAPTSKVGKSRAPASAPSPFSNMSSDEMTSFLRHSTIKQVQKTIQTRETEFDNKLKDFKIRVDMGSKKFGAQDSQRVFVPKGETFVEKSLSGR